ncbi:MAG: hypothetical protein A2287_08400 [Candidatus Melainabacteria bacterium RIFOXYA12_FULL_32_12]|nr:MAG: hypothetical protein A2287_08400 [Candidatus Melainabacteria bacterium RIFOXYA12_FULL_32_12]
MSIPKQKLYELIDEIPDNETDKAVVVIEDFIKNIKKSRLSTLYSEPIKVEGTVEVPSREERNER